MPAVKAELCFSDQSPSLLATALCADPSAPQSPKAAKASLDEAFKGIILDVILVAGESTKIF